MKKLKTKMSLILLDFFFSSKFLTGSLFGIVFIASGCGGCNWPNATNATTNNSAPSGFYGTAYYCNSSANGSSATGTLHIEATLITPLSGATGSATMNENIPVSFPATNGAASSVVFKTNYNYKQGTWQITKAQIVGLTGALPMLPKTVSLPGGLGTPKLDFTGGNCLLQ